MGMNGDGSKLDGHWMKVEQKPIDVGQMSIVTLGGRRLWWFATAANDATDGDVSL
jgi:hypothetical protein